MRYLARFVLVVTLCCSGCKPSESTPSAASESPASEPARTVANETSAAEQPPTRTSKLTLSDAKAEAGCATCIFDMKGVTGCKLAVKIDGRAYLVEGSGIDDHGDAHAEDGLCNAARPARVSGHVEGDKFVASKIELLP